MELQAMVTATAIPRCPRCSRPGTRNHDEWMCFDHGTFAEPPRPWDATNDSRGGHQPQPWSEEDRQAWDTWEEKPMEELTADDIVAGVRKRISTLTEQARDYEESLDGLRTEAQRLHGLMTAMGEDIVLPPSLKSVKKTKSRGSGSPVPCGICDKVCVDKRGAAIHRKLIHKLPGAEVPA